VKPSEARLLLGPACLLSVERAAELLPIRDSEARKLIEESGIVRRLAGRRTVRWDDCLSLAKLEQPAEPERPRPVRRARQRKR